MWRDTRGRVKCGWRMRTRNFTTVHVLYFQRISQCRLHLPAGVCTSWRGIMFRQNRKDIRNTLGQTQKQDTKTNAAEVVLLLDVCAGTAPTYVIRTFTLMKMWHGCRCPGTKKHTPSLSDDTVEFKFRPVICSLRHVKWSHCNAEQCLSAFSDCCIRHV